MGRWEGLTAEEIRALDAGAHSTRGWRDVAGYQFPDGENLAQLSARAWPAFEAHRGARTRRRRRRRRPRGHATASCSAGRSGSRPSGILALGQDYAALSVLVWSG